MNEAIYRDGHGELLTYEQTAKRSNLGINTVMEIAKESGTMVKIGKASRVIYSEFLDYIIKKYRIKKDE